ncbi:hypothetical protein [Candidatus Phytoplasma gossypii]|uniref:hypothetical protein n=1 Tax=Candidatus Phytoplasma gossypii TaxID=2982629 RepID=UPI003B969297
MINSLLMIQGIISYFCITRNLSQLTYSNYIAESSCLKILAQTNGKPPSLEI